MTRPLVILGASGNALDVLDIVQALNAHQPTWNILGILDDARPVGSDFAGLTILGKIGDAAAMTYAWLVNTIGSDRSFRRRPQFVAATGVASHYFATLIHPLASVSSHATIGQGVCINPGVCVAGNVTVGSHVSLGPRCVVGHDAVIEDHAILAPGAIVSGGCHVGFASYVGAGAALRQGVRVGDRALVGMGAVVLRDVEPGTTVVGNPARLLERPALQPN
jgi:sugar O-acyltransferase (sialic acid O-acetyltransferase NeuD family)